MSYYGRARPPKSKSNGRHNCNKCGEGLSNGAIKRGDIFCARCQQSINAARQIARVHNLRPNW